MTDIQALAVTDTLAHQEEHPKLVGVQADTKTDEMVHVEVAVDIVTGDLILPETGEVAVIALSTETGEVAVVATSRGIQIIKDLVKIEGTEKVTAGEMKEVIMEEAISKLGEVVVIMEEKVLDTLEEIQNQKM